MNRDLDTVIIQIALIWMVAGYAYLRAARRDSRTPIDHIGIIWLGVFALYATIPALVWLFQGGYYESSSGRLIKLQPTVVQVVYLLNIAIAYMMGFAFVYLLSLRWVRRPYSFNYGFIKKSQTVGACLIVGSAFLCSTLLQAFGIIGEPQPGQNGYAVIAALPRVFQQLLQLAHIFSKMAMLVLMVALLQRWPRAKWLLWVYLAYILLSFNPLGSRSEIVTGLFGLAICWHVLVRPISNFKFLVCGFFGLIVFMAVGFYRGTGGTIFEIKGADEFDTLWGNAVELLQAKQDSEIDLPVSVKYSEFFAFIPSQLLWFEKSSLSIWFLDTFHPNYKAMGGGMAFGALSQAVIGDGILEGVIRGVLLGAIAGGIMWWVRLPSRAWWHFPVHLYLLTGVYHSIRDTTFRLWGDVIQMVFPAILFIAIVAAFLRLCRPAQPCKTYHPA